MDERDPDKITFSDDWEFKSDQERRRWALEAVGIRNGVDRPVAKFITDADEVLAYINGSSPPLPQQLNEAA